MAMDDLASQIDSDDLFYSFLRDDDLADLFGDHSYDFEEFNFVASNSVFDGTQAWDTLQDPTQPIQDFAAMGTSSCNFDHREFCGADTRFDASTAESQLDQWHAGFENDSFSSERQWGNAFEVADPVPLPTLPSIVNEVGGGSLANSICKPKRKLVMQDAVSKQKPEPLTMKDSIFIFHSDVKKKFKIPQRKRFETDRRKEVALNRAIGAFVQCKVRKESCGLEIPCQKCIKRAGSLALGRQLCTRQKLVATRFNHVDLLGVARFGELVRQLEDTFLTGTEQDLYIFWPSCSCHTAETDRLKVVVRNLRPRKHPFGFNKQEQMIYTVDDTGTYSECWTDDGYYAMSTESFPSLDELEESFFRSNHCCNCFYSGPLKRLHTAIISFCQRYCNISKALPLKALLLKAMRLKRLFCMYRDSAEATSSPSVSDSVETKYVSSWIKIQLRHHIAKGIVALELEILNELDRLVYGYQGIGRRNPIVIWACLWTLILTYRTHLPFIHWLSFLYDESRDSLHGLCTKLYNTLTSIYAALYKVTTPMIFDWRKDEVLEMLGGDEELIEKFRLIKTEMFWLHVKKHRLLNEDLLLKSLIVENENALVRTKLEEAKRNGIL